MSLLKKLASNIYFWIGLVIVAVLFAFNREQALRMLAELKLLKAEADGKNALLQEKKAQARAEIKKEKQLQELLKSELEKEKAEPKSPKEIEAWWNKK